MRLQRTPTWLSQVDNDLINLRIALKSMDIEKWLLCIGDILPKMQHLDHNGDWISESAISDLSNQEGLEYVTKVVMDWCNDVGL